VIEQAVVSLTSDAQSRLKELLVKEGNPQLALRIFVSGGGCSGMQYGMAFDDTRRADDLVVEQDAGHRSTPARTLAKPRLAAAATRRFGGGCA